MINAFGYYASAKGMVLVPDLSGLSSAAAIAALESSGLDYSLGTDVETSNSALDNLVATQSPIANTLVDYATVVSFSLYNFVAVPPNFPPNFPPTFPPACSGEYVYSVVGTSPGYGCPSGTANVRFWYDECNQLVDEVFISCVPPAPPYFPPFFPSFAPANCTTPRPFPECSCINGVWIC